MMATADATNPVDPSGKISTSPPTGATDEEPEKPPEISYEVSILEDNLKVYLRAHAEGSLSISLED